VAGLPDEILMAYADGELDTESMAQVGQLLAMDPDAQRRVALFQATGTELGQLYGAPALEPAPAHLVAFVMNYGKQTATAALAPLAVAAPAALAPARRASLKVRLRSLAERYSAVWTEMLVPQGARWHLAAASLTILVIGSSAGYMLSGGSAGEDGDRLAVFKNGQIFANGTLKEGLETLPGNQEARIAGMRQDATVMRVVLTFKAKGGSFCREYEIAQAGQAQYAGLACRNGKGDWAIQANVPQMAPAAGTTIADNTKMIDPVVDRLIEGDAFGKEEEKAALDSGWKQ